MAKNRYHVSVMKCPQSGVFVGTSPDIPGLTLETETREELLIALADVLPHLLVTNLHLSEEQLGDYLVEVLFEGLAEDQQAAGDPLPARPRILVEHIAATV